LIYPALAATRRYALHVSLLPAPVSPVGSLVDGLQVGLKAGILSNMSMLQRLPAAVVLVLVGANEIVS